MPRRLRRSSPCGDVFFENSGKIVGRQRAFPPTLFTSEEAE
jgi:hypothetical protein